MEIKEGMPAVQEGEASEEEKKEKSGRGLDWFLGNVKDCTEFLTVCWAFLMLTVFPVYVIDRYQDIGAYKFSFFSGVSTLFLIPGAALGLLYTVLRGASRRRKRVAVSWLDAGMLSWLLINVLSFLESDFKEPAKTGSFIYNLSFIASLLLGILISER